MRWMKKSFKKFIAAFMAALLALSGAVPAFALTEGTTYSFTTKYLDAYYDTGKWETYDGTTHDNYGQVALRNLTSNGDPVYCIQIYNETDSNSATANKIEDTRVWQYELSDTAQDGFKLVSILGYPNYNYGYSAQNTQLATQVLYWEFETGARKNYSAGCSSWAESIFDNYPNALKAYNAILEACSDYYTKPSFNGNTVELSGVGESNAVTLTDSNGVLSSFDVSVSNSKYFPQTSQTVTVTAGKTASVSFSFRLSN